MIDESNYTPWASVPQDWVTGPIFTVDVQSNRKITIGKNTWTIGVVPPHYREAGVTEPAIKGLNITHGEVICGLMSFVDTAKSTNKPIKFSMNKLAKTVYGNVGLPYFKKIKMALSDLERCWMSVESEDRTGYFRILGEVFIIEKNKRNSKENNENQLEFWFDSAKLHDKFIDFITDIRTKMFYINNEGLQHFGSNDLAKCIFMFLPSRLKAGGYHSQKRFRISLKSLFEQVNYNRKRNNEKSVRYQAMTRGKESVISLLNGASLNANHTLRLRAELQETIDGSDFNLVTWIDGDNSPLLKHSEETTTVTESFVRELGFSQSEWCRLRDKANSYTWPEHFRIDNWLKNASPGLDWQFKIYCQLMGENYFADILAAESDGKAGPGAMILKFRQWALTNNNKK